MKEDIQEIKKVLKKNYSKDVKDKAAKLSEIMGSLPEIYYQVVEDFCYSTDNDLVEMLLTDANIVNKHSSYK